MKKYTLYILMSLFVTTFVSTTSCKKRKAKKTFESTNWTRQVFLNNTGVNYTNPEREPFKSVSNIETFGDNALSIIGENGLQNFNHELIKTKKDGFTHELLLSNISWKNFLPENTAPDFSYLNNYRIYLRIENENRLKLRIEFTDHTETLIFKEEVEE